MRFELLGTSFIPQHSDARILDQLVYKWDHTRRILKKVLVDRIRAAAVVAESALDNEQAIDLPPRPTKATLGTLAGLKPHTVTRCFQDSDELRRLYEMLRSPDDVLRFGKVRRRG